MHPALVAFHSLLPINGALIDVYVRSPSSPGFNTTTGIRTSTKTKYPRIQAVECPVMTEMFRAPNAPMMHKQSFTTVLAIKSIDVPAAIKLNDYVFFRNQRFEVLEVTDVSGILLLLGVNRWIGDKREITWDMFIGDAVSYSDSIVQVP